jgi:hypothetical protein
LIALDQPVPNPTGPASPAVGRTGHHDDVTLSWF